MRKLILTIILFTIMISLSEAQDYKTGIGLRGGLAAGITLKHFLSNKAAFEGLLSTRWRGFEITGLYEVHNRFFDVDRLRWYYGFGAHLGFWNGRHTPWGTSETEYTIVGIDGILGIEYSFEEIPINLSLDWKPAWNIFGNQEFWGDGAAFSLRFIF